jgi:hypothetical protein
MRWDASRPRPRSVRGSTGVGRHSSERRFAPTRAAAAAAVAVTVAASAGAGTRRVSS